MTTFVDRASPTNYDNLAKSVTLTGVTNGDTILVAVGHRSAIPATDPPDVLFDGQSMTYRGEVHISEADSTYRTFLGIYDLAVSGGNTDGVGDITSTLSTDGVSWNAQVVALRDLGAFQEVASADSNGSPDITSVDVSQTGSANDSRIGFLITKIEGSSRVPQVPVYSFSNMGTVEQWLGGGFGIDLANAYVLDDTAGAKTDTASYTFTGNGGNVSFGALVIRYGAAADTTAPTYEAAPAIGTETGTTIPVTATLDEDGTIYSIALTDGTTAPTDPTQARSWYDTGAGSNNVVAIATSAATASTEATATLTGLTSETDYDVYAWAEDDEGTPNVVASLTTLSATTADATAPTYDVVPALGTETGTTIPVTATINESGNLYAIALTNGATAPSDSAQAKSWYDTGTGSNNVQALGTTSASASLEATVTLTGLSPETEYDVYVWADDDAGNAIATTDSLSATTTDTVPPTITSAFALGTETGSTIPVTVTIGENGTVYAIALTNATTAPSDPTQARSWYDTGTGSNNVVAIASSAATASVQASMTLTGLSASTEYDVYCWAEDDESTPNVTASLSTLSATTDVAGFSATIDQASRAPGETFVLTLTSPPTGSGRTLSLSNGAETVDISSWITAQGATTVTGDAAALHLITGAGNGLKYDTALDLVVEDDGSSAPALSFTIESPVDTFAPLVTTPVDPGGILENDSGVTDNDQIYGYQSSGTGTLANIAGNGGLAGSGQGQLTYFFLDADAVGGAEWIGPATAVFDFLAPTVTSAAADEVTGASLTINFSEAGTAVNKGGFSLGIGETLTYQSGQSGSAWVYSISPALTQYESPLFLSYTSPGDGFKDQVGYELADFAGQAVSYFDDVVLPGSASGLLMPGPGPEVVVEDNTVLLKPPFLTASPGDTEVTLTWADSSTGEEGYQYRLDGGTPVTISDSVNAVTTTITGLTNATEYDAEVRAYAGGNFGPWSDVATFTPSVPAILGDVVLNSTLVSELDNTSTEFQELATINDNRLLPGTTIGYDPAGSTSLSVCLAAVLRMAAGETDADVESGFQTRLTGILDNYTSLNGNTAFWSSRNGFRAQGWRWLVLYKWWDDYCPSGTLTTQEAADWFTDVEAMLDYVATFSKQQLNYIDILDSDEEQSLLNMLYMGTKIATTSAVVTNVTEAYEALKTVLDKWYFAGINNSNDGHGAPTVGYLRGAMSPDGTNYIRSGNLSFMRFYHGMLADDGVTPVYPGYMADSIRFTIFSMSADFQEWMIYGEVKSGERGWRSTGEYGNYNLVQQALFFAREYEPTLFPVVRWVFENMDTAIPPGGVSDHFRYPIYKALAYRGTPAAAQSPAAAGWDLHFNAPGCGFWFARGSWGTTAHQVRAVDYRGWFCDHMYHAGGYSLFRGGQRPVSMQSYGISFVLTGNGASPYREQRPPKNGHVYIESANGQSPYHIGHMSVTGKSVDFAPEGYDLEKNQGAIGDVKHLGEGGAADYSIVHKDIADVMGWYVSQTRVADFCSKYLIRQLFFNSDEIFIDYRSIACDSSNALDYDAGNAEAPKIRDQEKLIRFEANPAKQSNGWLADDGTDAHYAIVFTGGTQTETEIDESAGTYSALEQSEFDDAERAYQVRFKVTPDSSNEEYWLTVHVMAATGLTEPTITELTVTGNANAVMLDVDGTSTVVVMIDTVASGTTGLTIDVGETPVGKDYYICGLDPAVQYAVTTSSNDLIVTPGSGTTPTSDLVLTGAAS